jgi:F0F1-type ATP synthase membrane subunit c/vacuolar-type H+-ATPase subunit K
MSILSVILQAVTDLTPYAKIGAGIGASIATIGAAIGISNIGARALESIARNPKLPTTYVLMIMQLHLSKSCLLRCSGLYVNSVCVIHLRIF